MQICSGIDLSKTEARGQCHSDTDTVVDTSRLKDVYNIGDMLHARFLSNRDKCHGHSGPKVVCRNLQHQDASTHEI